MQKLCVLFATITFFFLAGCSKDSSSTGPAPQQQAGPTVPTATFKGPQTSNTSDAHASMAIGYANAMNALMSPAAAFSGQTAVNAGNTYTWTYTAGTLTETFTAIRQGDGSYTWSWTLSGVEGTHNYGSGWTFWTGTTSADGKSGSWTFYEFGTTGKVADLVYTTNASNVLTGTWQTYDTSSVVTSKLVLTNNADNSGEINAYSDATHLYYKATWLANGTGSWWIYNSDGVTVASQGTWS